MDIHFFREGKGDGVFIRLDLGEPLGKLWFHRPGASPLEQQLLWTELCSVLDNQMQQIRKASYLCGWRDAKSKRRKETWFSRYCDVTDWEKKKAGL